MPEASCERSTVRERSTAREALAGLGLEVEQLRGELRASIFEAKEELLQSIEAMSHRWPLAPERPPEVSTPVRPPESQVESRVEGLEELRALHTELRGCLELCQEQCRQREERSELPVDQASCFEAARTE